MKKICLIFMLLLSLYNAGIAQSKLTIDKVYSVTLRNSGPIIENEQIKGYYFFYQSDKIDKKTNEYTLQIVDENLNKLKDIKFTDSKNIALLESSYNSGAVLFMFFDDDQNSLEYRLYGMNGKQLNTYSKVLDKKSESYFKQQLAMRNNEESQNKSVFEIADKGFISVTPLREDKNYTYDVNFYSSDKRRTWTYNPVETGKFTAAQYLGSNDSVAVFEVLSREKLMSKETESTLVGINLENGKKVFEARTQDGKQALYPMNLTTMNGTNQFLLIGPYYAAGEKIMQDKTEGLGVWIMDNKGKVVKSKYLSWTKELSKYVNVDDKGRVEDLGWMYFHKVLQTGDGRIFAIGEGYKKVADGLGIAMNILSGSYCNGVTKLKITNMMLLDLTPDFTLKSAKIYPKNNNSFSLSTASDFSSPHTLALAAKAYGAFDYSFTQMGQDKASFICGYTDYEKEKDYKGMTFNAISYNEGKITTDKINLKTEASNISLMPARPGSVLLMEYFKKAKRLDIHMEKINY